MSKRDRAGADLDRDSPAPSDNPSGGDPSTAAARAWVRATVGDTPPPRKRSNPGPRPLEHLAVHLPPSPLVPRHHHHTHFQQPQQQQPQYFFAPPTDAAMAGMGSTPPATMETSSMAVGAPHLILSVPLPPSSLSADGCSGGGIGGGGGALYFPPPGAPSPGIVGSPPYPHLLPQYQQQQQQHPQFAQFQQQPQYHHGMVDSLAHSTEQLSMRSRGSSQSNGVAPFLGQHVPSPAELHGALARLDAGQRPNASASTSGSVADSFDMGTEIGGQTTPTHEHVPKRRPRATKEQLEILEDAFLKWSAPPTTLRDDLAARVGMTPRSVQIWFQNKRAKVKLAQRKAQAEVVASSGSGQQDPGVASTHAAPSDGTQEQQQQQQRLGGKSHSSSSPSPPRDQPTTSSSRLPMTIMVPVDYSEAQQQHQQHHHHQSGTELGPADYPLPLSAATTAPPTPVPTFGGDRSAAASNAANAVYGHSDFSAASSAAAMDLLGFFTLTTDSLLIGTWRRISMDRSRTLVCAYSLHNRYFRWTVTDGQHTFRMEVPFSTVRTMVLQRVPEPPQDSSAMRPISPTTAEMSAVPMSAIMLRNQARPPAELTLTLSQAPAYWMELANTTTGVREWTRCHDFTENRQADLHLTHKLRGDCDAMRNQVQQILLADVGLRSIGYISADLFPPPPTGPAFPAEGTPMAMTPVDALFSPVSPYMHRPPQEPMSLIYAEMLSPTTVVPPATSSAGYSPMQSPTGAFMVPVMPPQSPHVGGSGGALATAAASVAMTHPAGTATSAPGSSNTAAPNPALRTIVNRPRRSLSAPMAPAFRNNVGPSPLGAAPALVASASSAHGPATAAAVMSGGGGSSMATPSGTPQFTAPHLRDSSASSSSSSFTAPHLRQSSSSFTAPHLRESPSLSSSPLMSSFTAPHLRDAAAAAQPQGGSGHQMFAGNSAPHLRTPPEMAAQPASSMPLETQQQHSFQFPPTSTTHLMFAAQPAEQHAAAMYQQQQQPMYLPTPPIHQVSRDGTTMRNGGGSQMYVHTGQMPASQFQPMSAPVSSAATFPFVTGGEPIPTSVAATTTAASSAAADDATRGPYGGQQQQHFDFSMPLSLPPDAHSDPEFFDKLFGMGALLGDGGNGAVSSGASMTAAYLADPSSSASGAVAAGSEPHSMMVAGGESVQEVQQQEQQHTYLEWR